MNNYTLQSSQEIDNIESPIHDFNQSNTFAVTTNNFDVVHSYLSNHDNGKTVHNTLETNALIYAKGEFIDTCFEIGDRLKLLLPQLSVTHEFSETTIIDKWTPRTEGLCSFKVIRKIPTVYIMLKVVVSDRRKVSSVPRVTRTWEGQRRKGDKRNGRIGLVLDDTVNINKHNK
ncbi:hypothetical protein LOD99_6016 [Oopsacas minuta]|uniref:Uncharacterized protein n=1 Tax=Oopsacas minuta TaxID=111878 RepID=A0AAV7JNH3_9METZ|nr:hypothetical protein LOD99_6016 [Oopsacas minuta]